jgi:hypothetical protein
METMISGSLQGKTRCTDHPIVNISYGVSKEASKRHRGLSIRGSGCAEES